MAHQVTLIRGDGTGPELVEATRRVLEGTGVAFEWDVVEAGVDIMETAGTPLPENVLASIRKNKVALKGPITTPIGTGFRSVNVALRKELDLYACIRPCKSYQGVRSRYENIDLVIVRENTEDLYAGVEYPVDSAEAGQIIDMAQRQNPARLGDFDQADFKDGVSPDRQSRRLNTLSKMAGARLRQLPKPTS